MASTITAIAFILLAVSSVAVGYVSIKKEKNVVNRGMEISVIVIWTVILIYEAIKLLIGG